MADDIVTRLRTVDEFSDAIGIMDAAASEIEHLTTMLDQFHDDVNTLFTAALYGLPPDTWNGDRQKMLMAEVDAIDARHRRYAEERHGRTA